jgi:excinuclease ABC subunit A
MDAMIRIRGARVHNLQDIHLDIPRNKLIVFTGPSGSGKSSLAFDTLYAEGKRQYMETLSVHARQFLDQVPRPDVDYIEGLQPTLCIDQNSGNQNPRSTVGTVTEIYDYLRVLMARLGEAHCYQCGGPIRQQTLGEIVARIMALPEGAKVMIMSPLIRGRKGTHEEVLARVRRAGLIRVRVDGMVGDLDQIPPLSPRKSHDIDAVVDRIVIRPQLESRLTESVQTALEYGDGVVIVCHMAEGEMPRGGSDADSPKNPGETTWHDELHSTRHACPKCGTSYGEIEPRTFSFNSPYGACTGCDGMGKYESFDPTLVMPNLDISIADGGIAPWRQSTSHASKGLAEVSKFLTTHAISASTPLSNIPEDVRRKLLHGEEKNVPGVLVLLEKEYATSTDEDRLTELARYRGTVPCQTCHGSRLRAEAASVTLRGKGIHQIASLSINKSQEFIGSLEFSASDQPIAEPLIEGILGRLDFLDRVGLGYLSLSRSAESLSGGEFQRVRLATSIGSGLVGVCYILDEPSIGLHQRDSERLIDSLRNLQRQGNTVIVVEHDAEMIRIADHLVDIGPGAGNLGGRIVAQGDLQSLMDSQDSLTGQYLGLRKGIKVPGVRRVNQADKTITMTGVRTHNLKQVDVAIPLGVFVCITGVSGSGKSSLINHTLSPAVLRKMGLPAPQPGAFQELKGIEHIDKVIRIDQSPLGRSTRGNAATYTGVFDEIRKLFAGTRDAKQRGFKASRFSFNNREGRCEICQGHGQQRIEMNFLPDLFVTCEACRGERFNQETLAVRFRGRSIADILAMNVTTARQFFENIESIRRPLESLEWVGLGYLQLGQRSSSLSGGEAQRVKLGSELARLDTGKTLYLLDEPTTGLHFHDVAHLLEVLHALVDRGNSMLVIEHNLDVIKTADWIIDLGPEGGELGGQVVVCGTPEQVAQSPDSHTGRYLKSQLA